MLCGCNPGGNANMGGYLLGVAGRLALCSNPSSISNPAANISARGSLNRCGVAGMESESHWQGTATYAAGRHGCSARTASAGSSEDRPSAHYAGTSSRRPQARTAPQPGSRPAYTQGAAVDERRPHRLGTGLLVKGPRAAERRQHGSPEPPEQQHARAPLQPCAGLPPPSCGLSTPCGSP